MGKMTWKLKTVLCFVSLMLPVAHIGTAADYVAMSIEPQNVGVFVENQTQQFECFGILADGTWHNITTEVDWYVEEYPFASQTFLASETATVDENGLATIHQTWGRAKISACYPIGCARPVGVGGSAEAISIHHINHLLLPEERQIDQ